MTDPDDEDNPDTPQTIGALKSALLWLNQVKEILAIIVFFAGGLIWVVNYFATRDALDQLDCFTRVNVRRLQATENVNYTQQQARTTRSDLRDQQRLLKAAQAQPNPASEDLNAYQTQIDDLNAKIKSFADSEESENKASGRWLSVLTGNACYQKEQRKIVIDAIAHGE